MAKKNNGIDNKDAGQAASSVAADTAPIAAQAEQTTGTESQALDPEIVKKIAAVRSHVRESFGKIVMSMMMMPRYRNETVADLNHLVLEPLIRDRIAMAYPADKEQGELTDVTGVAIWASVSEEADARIREQIKAGVFPLRLKPEDWNSGNINWLLDVIAPDKKATASVIANFKQVVKDGSLRLHPMVSRLVDPETLQKMGAEKMGAPVSDSAAGKIPEPIGNA